MSTVTVRAWDHKCPACNALHIIQQSEILQSLLSDKHHSLPPTCLGQCAYNGCVTCAYRDYAYTWFLFTMRY